MTPVLTKSKHRRAANKLTPAQCHLLKEGFNRARHLQRPLNAFLTVNWAFAPSVTHPVDRFQRLAVSARRWFHFRGIGYTWGYVWEKRLSPIQHLHQIVHVPPHLIDDFGLKVRDWVAQSADDGVAGKQAVKVEPIWNEAGLFDYLIKDADKTTRGLYGLPPSPFAPRPVDGKRAEVSRDLRDISWPDEGDGRVQVVKDAA